VSAVSQTLAENKNSPLAQRKVDFEYIHYQIEGGPAADLHDALQARDAQRRVLLFLDVLQGIRRWEEELTQHDTMIVQVTDRPPRD
jgi:hypothetical protein